jgi:hypothetical protein
MSRSLTVLRRPASPARPVLLWMGLSLAMASASATVGYLVGSSVGATAPEPRPPQLLQLSEVYASGLSDGYRHGGESAHGAARRAVYGEGLRDGRRDARTSAERKYRKGSPAYDRIFRRGFATGGERALSGHGSWRPGSFYIVSVARGKEGVGYAISSRLGPLGPGERYGLCARGARICAAATGVSASGRPSPERTAH